MIGPGNYLSGSFLFGSCRVTRLRRSSDDDDGFAFGTPTRLEVVDDCDGVLQRGPSSDGYVQLAAARQIGDLLQDVGVLSPEEDLAAARIQTAREFGAGRIDVENNAAPMDQRIALSRCQAAVAVEHNIEFLIETGRYFLRVVEDRIHAHGPGINQRAGADASGR